MLVTCVSGAQLSNYATYLVEPEQAPLSIVLTALSTACGVVATPLLALLMLGQRVPVDAKGMSLSIMQIVILPVAAGLLLSKYLPGLVRRLKPVLSAVALLDTCACVGASLSSNAAAARTRTGALVLVPVLILHGVAFVIGHKIGEVVGNGSPALAHTLSLQTGMQSSLLALLLASNFFSDPLTCLPCGLSVIVMTLGGFALVVHWNGRRSKKTG
eukprot:jgi/Astpho2/5528/Aster-02792